MLATGFIRFSSSQGQLRVYHFQLVHSMALFSSSTFLSAKGLARDELFHSHWALRYMRVLCMLAICSFLVPPEFLVSHSQWGSSFNCPAQCLLATLGDGLFSNGRFPWLALLKSLLYLYIYYFAIRAMFLKYKKPTRNGLSDWYSRITPRKKPWFRFIIGWLWKGAVGVLLFLLFFSTSKSGGKSFAILFYVLAILTFVHARSKGQKLLGSDQTENQWGFGQVLPFFLLAILLVSALEVFSGTFRPPQRNC